MDFVRLIVRHDRQTIHPMHRFVADHEAFDAYRLVHWDRSGDGIVLLFHVVGDPDVYEDALEDFEGGRSFDVTRRDDDSFTVYVRDAPAGTTRELLEEVTRGTLVPVPPVEYRSDWSVRFSLVGDPDDLRRALASIADAVTVEVLRVGEYDGSDAADAGLTRRQRETLRVARRLGYYEVPREASVADVAAELDCAPGTAAEHLRKAEARVIGRLEL